jgi:hypothetical protein
MNRKLNDKRTHPAEDLRFMDFLLVANNNGKPALHWETLMNYKFAKNYYAIESAKLIGPLDNNAILAFRNSQFLPEHQIALLLNGARHKCLREIIIYLCINQSEINFAPYFLQKDKSIQFFGTIIPKILFFAQVLKYEYYPEKHGVVYYPVSLETKKAFLAGNRSLARSLDPYNGRCYEGLANDDTIKNLKLLGVPDEEHYKILVTFRKNYNTMMETFKTSPLKFAISDDTVVPWHSIYTCFKEIYINNCAINYYNTVPAGISTEDEAAKSKNLFILGNNSLCKISDSTLASHNILAHNLAISKIYYTATKIENNVQEFEDIL